MQQQLTWVVIMWRGGVSELGFQDKQKNSNVQECQRGGYEKGTTGRQSMKSFAPATALMMMTGCDRVSSGRFPERCAAHPVLQRGEAKGAQGSSAAAAAEGASPPPSVGR